MNWESLKTFLSVATKGSLSGAAVELNVNHSTIFRRLKTLEDQIGGRLFEKIDNRYILTSIGEELRAHAHQIAAKFDVIERSVMGQDLAPKGTVRITAPFNIANRYLPMFLNDFRDFYPEIDIVVLSSNQEINMNSRMADIALRISSSPPEHLVGRKILEIPWGVFAGPSYIEKLQTPITLKTLGEHKLIGGVGQMLNLPAFRWLDQMHPTKIFTRCDELTAMSYFAEEGQGLAFLPLDQSRQNLICLCEFPQGKTSDLWVLTHPDLRKTERIKLLMKYLSKQFANQTFKVP
jgi:DNA-binding transcriptional LysR family regulator